MTNPIQAVGVISPTAQAAAAATAAGTTGSASKSLLDPQAFLQLLVAQLKYQDPSNPVDTSSFMNQTAMLSQVQTMSSMSSTLSALADAQQAQAATGLIGKQVTFLDSNGLRASGVVSSAALLASGATLQVGNASVPLTSVLEVSKVTPSPTITTTPTP
jgi:flagellar basal-body rod modification protein FlgD